ncbi:MAG: TIGR00266 family protein [Desulfurococcales archaeon]|nr:TIGR00266 family protein [Desulfurococcales archaeon]
MKERIVGGPAYSLLELELNAGEEVWFEAGAFVYSRGPIEVTTTSGGLGSALKRKLLGGESFFLNVARARGPSVVGLAPSAPGDIVGVDIAGELLVQDTSYLAHYGDLKVTTAWRGLKGWLSEGQFFWLKIEGRGRAWLSSYGALETYTLQAGETMIVDNFHLVAMDPTVQWSARKFGGWKSFLFGGEGIVFELRGPGRVWLQTRLLPALASLVYRYLPKKG